MPQQETSTRQEFPITFEKGLVTEVEESVLELGQAAELLNWEPAAGGGLRARNAWSSISKDGLPANYKVRGWGTAVTEAQFGFATPAIVQETALPDGVETGAEALVQDRTATLSGCAAGNTMVAVATALATTPGLTASAGWTVETINPSASGVMIGLFTKLSTGGTESITVHSGGVSLQHVQLFELSGVATVSPAAKSSGDAPSGTLVELSCDSTVVASGGTGIGLIWGVKQTAAGAPWDQTPAFDTGNVSQFNVTPSTSGASAGASCTFSTTPITGDMSSNTVDNVAGGMAIWESASAAGTPADFKILLAVATSTGYSIYRISRDQILTGTWELLDSAACSDTAAFVSMAVGSGELVWSASSMANPRYVNLTTLVGADLTDLANKAGRTVAFHKDRMFVGGSADIPSRLYFSGIGTPHTFTTATDYIDIGGEDGEAIEDLVSVEGLLLTCKINRLYLISGSGIESFFVNELPGGTASTGRPAIRTPYGTVVAGPTDIWVVQGGGVDPLSRPLGAQYSISGLVSTAYAQDVVLIADSGTGNVYRVNLVTGAWSIEEVTPGENQVGHLFSLQGRLYYGVINSATKVGGTRRLSSTRGADAITSVVRYRASTGRLALVGPSSKYTPLHVYVQSRIHDTSKPSNLRIKVETNLSTIDRSITVTDETQRDAVSVGVDKGIEWIQVHFEAESGINAAAIDVERTVLAAMVDKRRP